MKLSIPSVVLGLVFLSGSATTCNADLRGFFGFGNEEDQEAANLGEEKEAHRVLVPPGFDATADAVDAVADADVIDIDAVAEVNNDNEKGNDDNDNEDVIEDEYDETKVDHRHEGEGDHVVSYHGKN